MATVIHQSKQVARKEYDCDASIFITECLLPYDTSPLTFTEKRQVVIARRNNYKIQKGQVYIRQFNNQEGQVFTFRAIPEMHAICVRLKLYYD